VAVERILRVVWGNSCLGLPAPELCAPGKVGGYLVRLRALGRTYRYHTDLRHTIRYAAAHTGG
jgi:hypothetical protein